MVSQLKKLKRAGENYEKIFARYHSPLYSIKMLSTSKQISDSVRNDTVSANSVVFTFC